MMKSDRHGLSKSGTAVRPRAYSYFRMSSDVQLRGDPLRRQTSARDNWCERNGMPLDEDLRD